MTTQHNDFSKTRLEDGLGENLATGFSQKRTYGFFSQLSKTSLLVLKLFLFSSFALANAQVKKEEESSFHVALPLGQTLPENIWRIRFIEISGSGSEGFDEKGHKVDSGFDVHKRVSIGVLEYGWTSKLSFQLMAPYIHQNNLSLDGNRFRQSARYKRALEKAQKSAAAKIPSFVCGSEAACLDLIAADWSLPFDSIVDLPSGEKVVMRSRESIKSFSERLVMGAATPQTSGENGPGDMEAGALLNLFRDERFSNSIGLGLRIPTGSFSHVPSAYRPTGSGFYELGTRWNFDYSPVNGLWLSYQQTFEWALNTAKRERSSLVRPHMLKAAGASDTVDNHLIYKKTSPKIISEAQVNYGFGALAPQLKLFASSVGYKYQQDARLLIDGIQDPTSQSHYISFTATADGRGYNIPAAFDLNYQQPVYGRNTLISPVITSATLKIYAKF